MVQAFNTRVGLGSGWRQQISFFTSDLLTPAQPRDA